MPPSPPAHGSHYGPHYGNDAPLTEEAERLARPLRSPSDLQSVIDRVKDSRVVMLGESTHGTEDFYRWRALISEWLIVKHGFNFIAVEGDWPSCRPLHRYILSTGDGGSARQAIEGFRRWPTWMWANTEVTRLAEWLKSHNARVAPSLRAGFYGLDVYSLFESMDAVIQELEKVNLFHAKQARLRYACFGPYGRDEQAYIRSLARMSKDCERQVVDALRDLLRMRLETSPASLLGVEEDALFHAQQNARVVMNAEKYYRAMIHADDDSWNVRDRHMLDSLEWLLERHDRGARADGTGRTAPTKAIVWAHNTHIGDYRATSMRERGLINLGGLARERFGRDQVALVGFGTYDGAVTASHAWNGPIETMRVPPAKEGSYEAVFHDICRVQRYPGFSLAFDPRDPSACEALSQTRGHRAIGVVYDPEHERWTNYVPTELARRYDAFIFVDRTQALQPYLLPVGEHEIPDTWPNAQ